MIALDNSDISVINRFRS